MERARRHPTVLAVDANDMVLQGLKARLDAAGIDLSGCHNLDEALASFAESPTDVVVMELLMPDVDLKRVIDRFRQLNPDVRAMFFTGRDAPGLDDELRAAGAAAVMHKPCRMGEFVRRILELTGGRRQRRPD